MEASQTNTKLSKTTSIEAINSMSPYECVRYHNEHGLKLFSAKEGIDGDVSKKIKLDLLKVSRALGIQNPPTEEMLCEIIIFMIRNFGDFTPSEIYAAFELYAAGTIATIEIAGKTVAIDKPFGSFNLLFIGNVLNAYRAYRKTYLMNKKEVKLIEESKPISEDEWNQMNFNLIKDFIDKEGKLPLIGDFAAAYIICEELNLIEMTNQEKKSFLCQHREDEIIRLQEDIQGNVFKRKEIKEEINQLIDMQSEFLKRSARAAVAKNYFTNYLIRNQNK